MIPSHPLNKNIFVINGTPVKWKHVVGAIIATPVVWAILIVWGVTP